MHSLSYIKVIMLCGLQNLVCLFFHFQQYVEVNADCQKSCFFVRVVLCRTLNFYLPDQIVIIESVKRVSYQDYQLVCNVN